MKTKTLNELLTQSAHFYAQGKFSDALKLMQNLLLQYPDSMEILQNAGIFALSDNKNELALSYFQHNTQVHPNQATGHYFLGKALNLSNQKKLAIKSYETALKLDPAQSKAQIELALILTEQGQINAAKRHYRSVLIHTAKHIDAINGLAKIATYEHDYSQALRYYQQALKINSNDSQALPNFAILLLKMGDFMSGWKYYESRYQVQHSEASNIHFPKTQIPMYQGQDLTNKNLLIYPEQGFGDEIQFVRYVSLLKSQKGVSNIVLVCKSALRRLFSTITCVDQLLDINQFNRSHIEGVHYWIFSMSLPLCFNTTLEDIPNQLPYLSSPLEIQNKWADRLPKGLKVGLVWQGAAVHKNNPNRSLKSLKILKPLWQVKGDISFISLQKDNGEDEEKNPPIDQPLVHLGADIKDFSDTAAIVSQLDLVICIDTAIAHLSGSLNVPCWVLLPYNADWRWLIDREDSPWYPDVIRLFRQTSDGDWNKVIDAASKALVKIKKCS